jgi:hypothetical protein
MNEEKTNGVLTKIGKIILNFKSTSLLSALAIIMGYYLKCQYEIIIIMAIMEILDGKIDLLFIYDDEKKLKQYFSKYSFPNSDHLTILNIYQQLYKENNFKYLNKDTFKKIDIKIRELNHYARSIRKKDYKYMNKKYELVTNTDYNKLEDKILYVLGKSHLFNLIHNNSTIYFDNNTKAKMEFFKITKINNNNYKYSICHSLVNRFNKKLFIGITKIPNHIIIN